MAYSPRRRSRYDASLSPDRSMSRSRSPVRYRNDDEEEAARNPGNNLYVTGLSSRVRERDVEEYFGREGKVIDCHLVTDPRTRESRGFAFVTMESLEAADRCIRFLDKSVFEGRVITVEKARRKRARTPTPGRYLGIKTIPRSSYYDRRNNYSDEDSPRESPRYSPYRKDDYSPRRSRRYRDSSPCSDASDSMCRAGRSSYRSLSRSLSPSYSPCRRSYRSRYQVRSRSPRYKSTYRSRSWSSSRSRSRSPVYRYRSAYRSRSRSPSYRRGHRRPSYESSLSRSPSPYRPSRSSHRSSRYSHRSRHRRGSRSPLCKSPSPRHSMSAKKAPSSTRSPRATSRSFTPYSDRGSDSQSSFSRH